MKVCVRCQTENSSDYKYCKFCGAELPCVDRKPLWEDSDNARTEPVGNDIPVSNDISVYEMSVFIGKSSDRIVPEFVDMQQKNKKVSWCWPVFLLGMFFGFFGMAAWFFYRKMNKLGFILLGFSFALQAANIIANFGAITELYRDVFSAMQSYLSAFALDPNTSSDSFNIYINELASIYSANAVKIFAFLEQNLGGIALPIVLGLFGNHLYKEHCLNRIAKIKSEFGGTPSYIMVLSAKGGTSAARTVGALILGGLIDMLVFSAPMIAFFIGA